MTEDDTLSGPASQAGGVRGLAWVGIVANAGSGRGRGRARVKRLVGALRRAGLRVRIAWTEADRTAVVAESAADPLCRCLVAVGGDGTVAALVNERPAVPITVLASGTENLFARQFRLPRDPERLAEVVVAGRAVPVDLGDVHGRRFALMAGFGFDAEVVTRHHRTRVGPSGLPRPTRRAAYVEPILASSFHYRFPAMTVQVLDPGREEQLEGATIFLFNLPRYAMGLPFAPTARGDDGWLDLVVFRNPGPLQTLHYLWLVFRGLHLKRPGVEHRVVRRAVITADGPVPVQLDGDPGGVLPGGPDAGWAVAVLPAALRVLVP
jgi:diacylglycerol kinase family enzyme